MSKDRKINKPHSNGIYVASAVEEIVDVPSMEKIISKHMYKRKPYPLRLHFKPFLLNVTLANQLIGFLYDVRTRIQSITGQILWLDHGPTADPKYELNRTYLSIRLCNCCLALCTVLSNKQTVLNHMHIFNHKHNTNEKKINKKNKKNIRN